MELLAVFGINYKLLLFQIFNFGLLLFALWYFLYTPVMRLLDERRTVVEKGVRDAEEAEKALVEAGDESKKIVAKGVSEAEEVISLSRVHAKEEALKVAQDADMHAAVTIRDAKRRADEEKAKTLSDAQHEIARMVVLGAEKVLKGEQKL